MSKVASAASQRLMHSHPSACCCRHFPCSPALAGRLNAPASLNPAAGLTKVEMVMSKENPGLSRGFCFAEFYNHAAAAAAKNALSAPDFRWTVFLPAVRITLLSVMGSCRAPTGTCQGVQPFWPATLAASMQRGAGGANNLQQLPAPAACARTRASSVLLG